MVRLEKIKDTYFRELNFHSENRGIEFVINNKLDYSGKTLKELEILIIKKRCKFIKESKQCNKINETSNGYCMIHWKYLINLENKKRRIEESKQINNTFDNFVKWSPYLN